MKKIKLYKIPIGSKVFIEQSGEHTFMGTDGAYCKWLDNKGDFWIGVNLGEEVKKEYGIYLLVT